MNTEALLQSAWHESGRVVFTYLNGFSCDLMELSDLDPGRGGSRLNAGDDLSIVQAVLKGNPMVLTPENLERGISIAKKLMSIYCAGTCTVAFFNNNKAIPLGIDLEIPGHDLRNIELIQKFLSKAVPGHPEDFPARTMAGLFKKLGETDVCKAIELLASKAVQADTRSMVRFSIEDTLMASGLSFHRQASNTKSGYTLDLQEDKEVKSSPQGAVQESPLEIVLKDFIRKMKPEWKEDEVEASSLYIRSIFKKYS